MSACACGKAEPDSPRKMPPPRPGIPGKALRSPTIGSPAPRRAGYSTGSPSATRAPERLPPGSPRRSAGRPLPCSPGFSPGARHSGSSRHSGSTGRSSKPSPQHSGPLFRTFRQFASFGRGTELQTEMAAQQFVKLCQDCGLCDARFAKADAELVFARVRGQSRSIEFPTFRKALAMVARKKGSSAAGVEAKVAGFSMQAHVPSIGNATTHNYMRIGDYREEATTYVVTESGDTVDLRQTRQDRAAALLSQLQPPRRPGDAPNGAAGAPAAPDRAPPAAAPLSPLAAGSPTVGDG